MRINFYDARIAENGRTILAKEKGVNYETVNLNGPQGISAMMQDLLHMTEMAEEHCYMIALNSACRILGLFFLSKGTVNLCLITPREYYIRALLAGAVRTILCHNHPSGDVTPSKDDVDLTTRIKDAGMLLNVCLLDHIVIGRDTYYSFKEHEML